MKYGSELTSVAHLVSAAPVPRPARRNTLLQQASRLSLRSVVRATAMGFGLLAPTYAGAQCLVTGANVQCSAGTTTTDTTYSTNAPNDRGYLYNMPAPVTLTIDDGVQIDGYGLAITNESPTGGVTVVNSGRVIVDAGRTPTTQGNSALSITAAAPIIYNGSGSIINYGAGDALKMAQFGAGGINVSATGIVSSANGAGINAQSSASYIAIATGVGAISGGHGAGITAISAGAGPVLVTTGTGSVTTLDPIDYFGVDAQSAGGDVTVSIGSGGVLQGGAYAKTTGAGNLSLSMAGNINDTTAEGVDAIGDAGTVGVSLAAGTNVTGTSAGIYANSSSGKITVLAGDGSTITGGNEGVLAVSSLAGGDIKIAVANAIGGFGGIYAHGAGAVDVSATGNVTGATAIEAAGGGPVRVTTGAGAISGSNGAGIKAISGGTGPVTVTTGTGSVTTLDPLNYFGVDAESAGGDVTVSIGSGGVLQGGAYAKSTGAGNVSLSTTGNISQSVLAAGETGTVNVSLAPGTNVTGRYTGVGASSTSGKITVLAGDGNTITGARYGVAAVSTLAGGDIRIAVANATGAAEGIYAYGLSAIDVSASGNVTGGTAIDAEGGGPVSVTTGAGAISGSNGAGIKAISGGTGPVTVTTGTGSVTALDPVDYFGLDAESAGGDVTVSIGSGGVLQGGAYARSAGTGSVSLSTAGNISQSVFAIGEAGTVNVSLAPGTNVTGNYTGVAASSTSGKITALAGDGSTITGGRYGVTAASTLAGGDIKIAVANVITNTTGATGGIYATGVGAIDVSASGIVKGGTGIDAEGTIGPITVTTGAGAITGGNGSGIKAVSSGAQAVTVTTGTGSITTLDPVDYFGLLAQSAGGDVTVSIGSGGVLQGGAYARTAGTGNLSLSTVGNITDTNAQGVVAIGDAGTVSVSLAPGTNVTGSSAGIYAASSSGRITVLAGGGSTISGGMYGVSALSTLAGGDIKVAVAGATGATDGIYATGIGAIDIGATGTVNGGNGIDAEGAAGPTTVTTAAGPVTGATYGVRAYDTMGAITVTTGAGAISGGNGPGILAVSNGNGAVTVTTGAGPVMTLDPQFNNAVVASSRNGDVTVTIGSGGIRDGGAAAFTGGAGSATLATAGPIGNTMGVGLQVVADAGAASASLGDGTTLTATNDGIYASTDSGSAAVSTGAISSVNAGGDGISVIARAAGGTASVQALGSVTSTGGFGITATTVGGTVDITTGAGAISGGNGAGIQAVGTGARNVTVTTGTGSVTTLDPTDYSGLVAQSAGGDVTVSIGSGGVLDGGARALTSGAGSVTLNAAGAIGDTHGDGLRAIASAGTASVSLGGGATITAAAQGIDARTTSGSVSVVTGAGSSVNSTLDGIITIARLAGGNATVQALGSVTSATGVGIRAFTAGGAINVATGSGSISGAPFGIGASSAGGNITMVTGPGTVSGATGILIDARGGTGTGTVTVNAGGNVTGISGAGIETLASTGATAISVSGEVRANGAGNAGVVASSTGGNISVGVSASGKIDPSIGIDLNTLNGALMINNAGFVTGDMAAVRLVATGIGSGTVMNTGTITAPIAVLASVNNTAFTLTNNGALNGLVSVTGANIGTSLWTNGPLGTANLGPGASSFAGSLNNSGSIYLGSGGTLAISGNMANPGRVTLGGPGSIAVSGSLANAGVIDLQNGLATNAVTVGGSYAGGGRILVDYNEIAGTADHLTIGSTATGNTVVSANLIGPRSFVPGGFIPIVTVAGGAPDGTFTGTGFATTGLVLESVGRGSATAAQFGIVQSINPQGSALGDLTYMAESASGLLDDPIAPSVTNRSDVGGTRFSLWARGSGGHATQTIGSTISGGGVVATDVRRLRVGHHAVQFGADLAFVDLGAHWTVNVGATGGWYGGDAPLAGGERIEVEAPFVGIYAALGNDRFQLEGNIRREWRHYGLNMLSIFGTSAMERTRGQATAGSVRGSYRIGGTMGFAATPFASFSYGDASIDSLRIDAITVYTPGSDKTEIGQGGVRLSYRAGDPDKTSVEPFASVARLENWSRGSSSSFAFGASPTTFDLQTATWKEAMRYAVGLTASTRGGRLSAFAVSNIDDDSRLGSFTVNAGVRLNF